MKSLLRICLLICLPLLLCEERSTHAEEKAGPPNIVFVIADDLGWADVAFHGGNAPTPVLDKLARENLELTQHYVAPVCSPTRTGLLTGRCWSRFGVTTPTNSRALPWDTVTMARALKSQGYETCLIGKWHLGSKSEWGPNRFGFDHAYGSLAGGVTPYSHRYKMGDYTHTWHRNGELLEEEGHVTDLLTQEAVTWIKGRGEKPFFLYVPYTAVHLPIKEPAMWVDRAPEAIAGEVNRHYAACVMHLDHCVGQILQALEETGARENTLFVFTSDNGGSTAQNNTQPYPKDVRPEGKLPGNNTPLRAEKGSVYEGGVRVPTIVSWPGRIKPGQADAPVYIADWMPTFCGIAGYQTSRDLRWDGVDLAGYLRSPDKAPPELDRPIYLAGPGWRGKALRHGDWKLVVHGAGDKQKVELFNLANDPSEKSDLAGAEPERTKTLLSELEKVAAADKDAVAND